MYLNLDTPSTKKHFTMLNFLHPVEMALSPFLFNFECQACKGRLQAELNEQGASVSCPLCNNEITVPSAPPRPIEGWLFIPALGYTFQLGMFLVLLLLGAIKVVEKPELMIGALFYSIIAIPAAIGAWAMWKKKRWFRWFYLVNCWGSTFLYLGASIYGRDSDLGAKTVTFAIWSIIWTLYFLKSQRVKETFIQ